MKKSDLKNGMIFQIRYGTKYYIVLNEIYTLDNSVSYTGSFYNIMKYYKEDLKYDGTTNNDIMYVYDSDGNLIWERDEQQIDSLIDFIKNEDIEAVKEFFKLYGIEFTKTKKPSNESMRASKISRKGLEEKIRKIIDII